MLAPQTFFSFTRVPEPADHIAYNEWHQLDHRPENLALPGVIWGDRWVHDPACSKLSRSRAPLEGLHYCNMYWFADPVTESRTAWAELAERSFHWGRRRDVHIAERLLMDFFRPIKGYASSRVLVSPNAVPFRPVSGIHLTVTRVQRPRSPEAESRFAWHDRTRIPQLLERPGCAGAWNFASESAFSSHLDMTGGEPPETLRIQLLFLDRDPVEFTEALHAEEDGARDSDTVETVLFAGPLRTIPPWEWHWDWSDDRPEPSVPDA